MVVVEVIDVVIKKDQIIKSKTPAKIITLQISQNNNNLAASKKNLIEVNKALRLMRNSLTIIDQPAMSKK